MSHEELTQIDVLRRMTPGERLQAAMDLYWSAKRLKASVFQAQHPDWSEVEIEKAVNEAFLRAGS